MVPSAVVTTSASSAAMKEAAEARTRTQSFVFALASVIKLLLVTIAIPSRSPATLGRVEVIKGFRAQKFSLRPNPFAGPERLVRAVGGNTAPIRRGGLPFSIVFGALEHDPEKWIPVFGKDHAPPIGAPAGEGR